MMLVELPSALSLTRLFDPDEALRLYEQLRTEIPWYDGSFRAGGRLFQLPRLQAWFADPGIDYQYAENLLNSHPWTTTLADLRTQVEAIAGARFNSVLANFYRNGRDSVGWHADDEADLGPLIASLSLGETRTFSLRPRSRNRGKPVELPLVSGTLLLMRAPLKQKWNHAIPPIPEVTEGRINLTFRQIIPRN